MMPVKLMDALMLRPSAQVEQFRIFSCTQIGFSSAVCAGGDVTAGDLNNWVKFSNAQGKEGFHFSQITTLNFNGKPSPFYIYESP